MAAPAFADSLREIYALARRGQYQPAETLCGELLRQRADNPELWLLRGIIQLQTARPAQAVTAIREALHRGETRAATHALLGDALLQSGAPGEAIKSYERALKLNPALISAHLGRGSAHLDGRQPEQALVSFDAALALSPDDWEAWCKRALALIALDRLEEATLSLDRSLSLRPDYALGLATRGAARLKRNDFQGALADLDAALELAPAFVEAMCNRGSALRRLSRPDEALEAFQAALKIRPDGLAALRGRAEALREMRQPQKALAAFLQTLHFHPTDADTLRGQGDALLDLTRPIEALAAHERALRQAPGSSDAQNSRGNSLYALERFEAAIEAYQRALKLDAGNAVAHYNLGTALLRVGTDPEAVIEHFTAALEIQPEFPNLPGALAYAKRCVADWSFDDADADLLERRALEGARVAAPFHLLGLADAPEALRRCAETYLKYRLPPGALSSQVAGNVRARPRIAYLSSDFREHALARLMSGVFEQHDRNLVEVIGISLAHEDGSEFGGRVRSAFDRLVDVSGLDDEQAVLRLRELEIDIAIDLNGLTDGARPALWRQRIAPIQVNYLGFPGTSGASYMDYILADEFVIPPSESRFYQEQVVHLPCFQAYDDTPGQHVPAGERAAEGLPAEGFVFCCFNHTSKLTPAVFGVWARILNQVPGSVLWLLAPESTTRDNLNREAQRRDLDPKRLIFSARVSRAQFCSRLQLADLFLDTLPFNAGATASEVLRAGLPLLTAAGRSFASRMAGSLLLQVGLPQLVCDDLHEYEKRAVGLAQNPREISSLRRHLEQAKTTAAWFDTRAFTRSLEQALLRMHERRVAGLPPATFKV
jgi:predicted O-linked N-acetylglucosamine transferase (SPINDLY family)